MAELFENNAISTLSAGITAGAATMDVADGTVFPSPSGGNFFYATLIEGSKLEIVKCTARSLETISITRAQDGTTAQTFSAGALVSHRAVAATFTALAAGGGGGAVASPQFRSGQYYSGEGATSAGASVSDAQVRALPFFVGYSRAFDRIGVYVNTSSAALLRLGIYADDGGDYPGALVDEAGTIDLSLAPQWREITIAETLAPGWYWLAGLAEGATANTRYLTAPNPGGFMPIDTGGNSIYVGYQVSTASGSLPATFPAGATLSVTVPRIGLRAT